MATSEYNIMLTVATILGRPKGPRLRLAMIMMTIATKVLGAKILISTPEEENTKRRPEKSHRFTPAFEKLDAASNKSVKDHDQGSIKNKPKQCDGCDSPFQRRADTWLTQDGKGHLCTKCYQAHTQEPCMNYGGLIGDNTQPTMTRAQLAQCESHVRKSIETNTREREGRFVDPGYATNPPSRELPPMETVRCQSCHGYILSTGTIDSEGRPIHITCWHETGIKARQARNETEKGEPER